MFKITSNCSTHLNDLMELKSKTKTFFFFSTSVVFWGGQNFSMESKQVCLLGVYK